MSNESSEQRCTDQTHKGYSLIGCLNCKEEADAQREPELSNAEIATHEQEIPIHDFDPGRVDTGICQYRLKSGEICGIGFDVERHRTNNLVSRLDVLRVITALRDSRRLAAEEGDGPAYAEEIELCDKLAFRVRRLPNIPIQNQHRDAIGIVRELNKETFNRQITKSRDEWVAQCEILNELESRLAKDTRSRPTVAASDEPPAIKSLQMNFESRMNELARAICRRPRNVYAGDWQFVKDLLVKHLAPTVEAAEIRRQALEALADARECDNCEVAPAVWERSDDPETHWYACDEHKDSQPGWRENKAVRFAMTVAARDAAPTDPEKDSEDESLHF